MINFRNTIFIKSAPSYKDAPADELKHVLIVGRSNVGKSSLINALCDNRALAYTSGKPGYTKLLNFFSVDKQFYLVDAPGYGYSKSNVKEIDFFGTLMEDYFNNCNKLAGVIFLLDSRRETNVDDQDIFDFLNDSRIPFFVVLTKNDKINQSSRCSVIKHLNEAFGLSKDQIILTSSLKRTGLDKLRGTIELLIK